jgi:hypothetical protein
VSVQDVNQGPTARDDDLLIPIVHFDQLAQFGTFPEGAYQPLRTKGGAAPHSQKSDPQRR